MKRFLPILFFTLLTIVLIWEAIIKGWVPIPADIIVGHYHPWKDYTWDNRTAGFPIKNFELSDTVTQLYPWRQFSINQLKQKQFPLWNPYNLTGTPHLANLPTATFYPLNIFFFILPFITAWTLYLALQTILAGTFMYWFLANQKLTNLASLFGGTVFAFSSFSSMRYQYGIVGHTWLWLPLILLSIDKLFSNKKTTSVSTLKWYTLGIFSLTMMILAGYLQGIIYGYSITTLYFIFQTFKFKNWNLFQNLRKHFSKTIKSFIFATGFFILPLFLTAIQLLPFLETMFQSSRAQNKTEIINYFLPWKNLTTLITPDFFGNPATHNFWGQISYTESAIYIGLIPLLFALFAIFFKKKPNSVKFWTFILILSFLFLLKNPLAYLPYSLNLPGYSALLPSRLTAVITFTLSILAAYGFHRWQTSKTSTTPISTIIILIGSILVLLWEITILSPRIFFNQNLVNNLQTISFKNLILPTAYLIATFAIAQLFKTLPKYNKLISHKKYLLLATYSLLLITSFDLLRQARKYNTLVSPSIIYLTTKSIQYLQSFAIPPRVLITHPELFPVNTNINYKIAMVDGYDSVHSSRIDELLAVLNGQKTKIDKSNFNRVTFSSNYKSTALNLISPEYIYYLKNENETPPMKSKYKLITTEGKTNLYQNLDSYPRVYLTKDIQVLTENQQILQAILDFSQTGKHKAILEQPISLSSTFLNQNATATITDYQPNQVTIQTSANTDALLVFNDAYDKGWKAQIDKNKTKLYRTNYAFRGIKIPPGKHQIKFTYQPRSFQIGKTITIFTSAFLFILLLKYIHDTKKATNTNNKTRKRTR